jgi:hypothetical protein
MADQFTKADAPEGLSETQVTTWVKVANKALRDGKSREDAIEAATKLAQNVKESAALQAFIREAGKVLSSKNHKLVKDAHQALSDLLAAADNSPHGDPDGGEGSDGAGDMLEALRESNSGSADDAAAGARILAQLILIIGDEVGEADQIAQLEAAYDAVAAWVKAEMAEIGEPDEDGPGDPWYRPWYESAGDALVAMADQVARLREADAPKKTEDGQGFPASDYAYVPDPEKPSTWKLRLTKEPGGDPDPGIVGAAAAALGKGFRGQKVDIPAGDLAKVKAAVRSAWTKANPGKDADDMPEGIKESLSDGFDVTGDAIILREAAIRRDGTAQVKIIKPGWGSSGFYPQEVLERDGPKVFTKGTKMFWDHPTVTEEAERPERSIRDLAAELESDARWLDAGPEGPGLYADAKVFSGYQEAVNELAGHIGVSIRAMGAGHRGDAEGKTGTIIEKLIAAQSIDFVTAPGAGGEIVSLFESARGRAHNPSPSSQEDAVDEKKLKEAEDRAARAEERYILSEAKVFVAERLRESNLPDITIARLSESLVANPPAKDGELDRDAFGKTIKEAIATEAEYLSKVIGTGNVRGMGANTGAGDEVNLAESFARLGLDEKAAASAARGRN